MSWSTVPSQPAARVARETHDYGFMYTRSFLDPDGHFWEVFWMDPAAAQDGPPERFTAAGERIDACAASRARHPRDPRPDPLARAFFANT